MEFLKNNIPIINTIATYKKEYFRFDFIAALTVAVVALPQSMAYAMIAGVDPAYGLYSAIVLAILGSVFGSSNHLATGPTNAVSLLISSYMAVYLGQGNFLATLFLLTFMVGAIQFAMGALKLGKLVNYVSHSVIVGFTAGAGVIIALGQLNALLGISLSQGKHSTLEKVMLTFENMDKMNNYALLLGIFTILVIIVSKKISKNIPGALLGIIFSVVLVMLMGLDKYGIKMAGEIPSAIPPFSMISLNLESINSLLGGAIVIAVIGLVEAVSISKAISAQTMQKIDPNQEFIGQGIANMGGAFFGSIAGSGSFTRSAIAFQNGGRTRLTGVITGIVILVLLLFFAPFAKYIPNASLAGVIMVVAYTMVDKNAVSKVFKSNRNDAIVMTITFLTTILAPELEYAIYSGIAISILLYLKETGAASVVRLAPVNGSPGQLVEYHTACGNGQPVNSTISVVQLDGNLYFGSSADLEQKLNDVYSDARVLVVKFTGVTMMDITSLEVIEGFISRVLKEGKKVLLCDVRPSIKRMMEKSHILSMVGEGNVFVTEEEVLASSAKALEKADAWLRGEIDIDFGLGKKVSQPSSQPVG
ncbi:sulfate permease [Desulfocucumis palustris]|uniref:Sulfate permease n=1 Tax=Desulfocucumis palustris TaxID=1898651 RepID=A0A2L2X9U6_9FIRM|nr:SulP family inorganic anion transporter [Desulfocucumis palustris]GBF33047.1 sulfate permease [Desulfocucumis palustris]